VIESGGLRRRGVLATDSPGRPLISVITPVMNGARHVRECIESVLSQTYPNVEHVIVDGGSTDGTLDILRAYDDRIAHWQSAPDRGIYDAMNRGLALARGSIIGIAGSDDAFYPSAAAAVHDALTAAPPEVAYAYGAVDLVRDTDEVFGRTEPLDAQIFEARPYLDMPFNHLSLFVRAEVYDRIGTFDLAYPVRADWDLVLRMLAHGYRGLRLAGRIGRYRVGGTSDRLATCFETRRLMRDHGAPRLWTEWRLVSSMAKLGIVSRLPLPVVRWLTRLKRSRHVFD
jgi:glycosyltransferase involved in cell wall biosynthesis